MRSSLLARRLSRNTGKSGSNKRQKGDPLADTLYQQLPRVEIEKIKEQLKRIDELLKEIREQNVFGIDTSQPTFNLFDASIEAQKQELTKKLEQEEKNSPKNETEITRINKEIKQLDVRKRLSIFHDFTDIQALQIVFIDDEEEQKGFKEYFTGPEPDKKKLYQRKLRTIDEILKNKDDFKQLIQKQNPFLKLNISKSVLKGRELQTYLETEGVDKILDEIQIFFDDGILEYKNYKSEDINNIKLAIEEYVHTGNILALLNNAITREYLFRKISNKDPYEEVPYLKEINKFFDDFTDKSEIDEIIEEFNKYHTTINPTISNYLLEKLSEYGLKLKDIKDDSDLRIVLESKGINYKKRNEIIQKIIEQEPEDRLKKMKELLNQFQTEHGKSNAQFKEIIEQINKYFEHNKSDLTKIMVYQIRKTVSQPDINGGIGINGAIILRLYDCQQIYQNAFESSKMIRGLIAQIEGNAKAGDYNFDEQLTDDRKKNGKNFRKHFKLLNHLKSIGYLSYENFDVSEETFIERKLTEYTRTPDGTSAPKYHNIIKLQHELNRKIQHLERLKENNFETMQRLINIMNDEYITLEYTKPLRPKVKSEISKKAIGDAEGKIVTDSDHSELKNAKDKYNEKAEYLGDHYKENYLFNNPSDDSSESSPESVDGINQDGFKVKLEEFNAVIKEVEKKFSDGEIDIDETKVEVATIDLDNEIKSKARSKIEIANSLIEVLNHFKDTVAPTERTRIAKDSSEVVVGSAAIQKGVRESIEEGKKKGSIGIVETLKDLEKLEAKLEQQGKTTKNRHVLIKEKLDEIGLTVDDETKLSDLKEKLKLFSETAGKYQTELEAALAKCKKATEAFNWEAEEQTIEKPKLDTRLYYDLDHNENNEFLETLYNLEESNKDDKSKQNQQGPQHCDLLKYLVSISHRNNNEFDTSILYLISHIPKELTDIISRQRSPHVTFENTITEFVKNLKSDLLDEKSKKYLKGISDDKGIIIENVKNLAQQLLSYYQYNKFEVDGRKLNSNKEQKYTFTSSHSTSPDPATTEMNPFELSDNKLQRDIVQFENDPRSVSEISEINSNSILQTFGFDDRHQSLSLRHFKFQNIKINNPNLTNAHFRFCDFEGVDFTKLKLEVLEKINFNNCNFTNCLFAEEHITYLKKLDHNPTQSVNFQNCRYKIDYTHSSDLDSDSDSLSTPSPITKPLEVTLFNTRSPRSIST